MKELDYVSMLEIPVKSCDIVYKPSKKKKKDVKKQLIEKVNENAIQTPIEKPIKAKKIKEKKPKYNDEESVEIKRGGFDIVSAQVVTIFVLVIGIILTNIFWEDSGINNILRSVFNQTEKLEDVSYSSFTATLPSKSAGVVLEDGVMTVSSGSIYSPCDGVIETITEADGVYTVTVKHSESFSSVISGLESVYVDTSDKVYSNIPMGYSTKEIKVSMFDGDVILTSYELTDNQIVWLG